MDQKVALNKGGDNLFEIIADGKNAAGNVQINLSQDGNNTFNFIEVKVDQDTKSWLENLEFSLNVGRNGSDVLDINGLGQTQVSITGVEKQTEGQINIYDQDLNHAQVSIDLASVVHALEENDTLTFSQKGRLWVASGEPNQTDPIDVSYTTNLDVNQIDSTENQNMIMIDQEAYNFLQKQNSANFAGKFGNLNLSNDAKSPSYNYELNTDTKDDLDVLGEQLAFGTLTPEVFDFTDGKNQAKITVNLSASLPEHNNALIIVGSQNDDTLNLDNYMFAKAVMDR